MRGAYLVGLVVILLIIGYLVMKNMGADNSSGVPETQTKIYMEKAKNTADNLTQKYKDTRKQVPMDNN
jgi:hypothetical protein